MRKLYLSAVALAAVFLIALAALPARVCFSGGKNHTYYTGNDSSDCREVKPVFNAELARLGITDVCGESVEYEDFNLNSFLESCNGKIIFTEELSDSVNYYCSADLPYSVNLYGKEINLHICVREDCVKVASPIIFGGY